MRDLRQIASPAGFGILAVVHLFITCSTAFAHSFGNGEADLTPPILASNKETEALTADFGPAAGPLRGVFKDMNLWNAGSTLKACFYDGDHRLKALAAKSARKWLAGTSLKVDFGTENSFRTCDSTSKNDIRISFAQKGNWSFVGTESIHPTILKGGASLNVETGRIPYERLDLRSIEETILHELGHALGLLHEHQSPTAKCGDEFDWPRVIAYAKKHWAWDEETVRHNFEPYIQDPRLRTTPYDRLSIMHYSLSDWMFKRGKKSRCFIKQPTDISNSDRATILAAYPPEVANQAKELQKRAARVASVMRDLNLNAGQVALAGAKIARSLAHHNRRLSLQFALADGQTVLRSGDGSLNPCDGDKLQLADTPKVSCGVAPDASGFLIEIDPAARQ